MLAIYPGHSLYPELFALALQVQQAEIDLINAKRALGNMKALVLAGTATVATMAAARQHVFDLEADIQVLAALPGSSSIAALGEHRQVLVQGAHGEHWQAAIAEARCLKEAAFAKCQARKVHAMYSLEARARLQG